MLKDRRGVGGIAITIISVVLLVAVLGIGYVAYQSVSGDGEKSATMDLSDCEEAPYLELSGFNASFTGDSIGTDPTFYHKIDGVHKGIMTDGSGGTDFVLGDKIDVLASKGNLIDKIISPEGGWEITKCGKNAFSYQMYETDAGTLDILDEATKVSDSTNGAVNISESANAITFTVRLDGVINKNTGKLLVTVEGNTTQIDEITVSGSGVVDDNYGTNLDLFSDEFSGGSIKYAFVVDAIDNGAREDYDVRLSPMSGITIGGGAIHTGPLYVNVYSAQDFVDTDGTWVVDGFENSQGTLKYEDKWTDHDFLIE